MKNVKSNHNKSLTKGARLNFQVFSTLDLDDENLEYLQLISSSILSGYLHNVSFYNASFLSTKFSNIIFEKCNLKNIDMCSVWANSCCFQNTDFSNATISDSTFIKCIFDGAIFKSISLTGCQFIDCTFEQFLIDDSTFSLNTYIRCHIKHTNFTESFYYQIFEDCTFHKVDMDPILLGFNFGFTPEVFSELTKNIDLIETNSNFIDQRFYINAAIFHINQVQDYYDEAMIGCVMALGKMIQHDILIKADEIFFLKNLTLYLQKHKKIAPISILRIWQLLTGYFTTNPPNTASNKAMPYIQEYTNMLYFDFLNFQEDLQKCLNQLPKVSDVTETAELKIIYIMKPKLPLLSFLTEFSALASPNCPTPSLTRTEKGSFIEYHNIAVAIIPYLQTFFSFLGIMVPIIIYKKQKIYYYYKNKKKYVF